MLRLIHFATAAALVCGMTQVRADDLAPAPSKHQLMKDCMAKQKASDAGLPKEQMKNTCRDLTKTEAENEHAEKAAADKAAESSAAPAPASP
jgi:hypothetical protein